MDYIILTMVSAIFKLTSTHLLHRKLFGAFLGALYACVILAFRLNGPIWKIFSYIGIVLLMSYILIGKTSVVNALKCTVLIYVFACAMGGCLHVIYYYTFIGYFLYDGAASTVMVLIGGAILAPAVLKTVDRIKTRASLGETRVNAVLFYGGEKIELPALVDTGNSLMDPIFNEAVNVVESDSVIKIVKNPNEMSYHLIPYLSIGNETGLIPVVRFELMTIFTARGKVDIEKPLIALYSGKVSGNREYRMIIHPLMLKNE